MSLLITTLIVSLISFIALYLISFIKSTYKHVKNSGMPYVGTFFPFGAWFHLPKKVLGEEDEKNIKEQGTIYWTLDGTNPNLFIADPNIVKMIFDKSEDFTSFRAGRVQNDVLKESLKVIEVQDYKNNILTSIDVLRLLPRVQRCTEALIQEIKSKVGENVYVQPCIMQYIGDVLAMTVFGMDLYSDEYKDQRSLFMEYINSIFKTYNPTSIRAIIPYITKKSSSLDESILPPDATKYFSELCRGIVEKKMSLLNKEGMNVEGRAVDVIDILLEAGSHKESEKSEEYVEEVQLTPTITCEEIIKQCLGILLFTVRRSEAALSQSLYILANNPEEQIKLQNDLKASMGDFREIGNEPKLDMFLKEIFRLYPTEFRFVRDCNKDMIINNINILSGMSVTIPIYALHRMEEFFTDALEFKPERFSPENKDKINEFSYLPYGQASSNPSFVGVELGDMFIKIALSALIQNYKFLPPVPQYLTPLEFTKGITGVPVTVPVFVQLETRT